MPLILPKGYSWFPQKESGDHAWKPDEVIRMYNAGFAGCGRDDEAKEKLLRSVEWPHAEDACHHFGLADSGEGGLYLTFPAIEQLYPGGIPGAAQQRGDCVSHDTKNAALATMCNEIVAGKPDELSGRIEGAPKVSATGIQNGILSTEYLYWWRGYNGDGWSCGAAADVARTKGALVPRNAYPEAGIDLSEYSGRLAGKYGSQEPPDSILAIGQSHIVRTVTNIETFESLRDLIANGYGVSSCGGEGFSNQRDENGFSRRSGSWSHAMAIWGVDSRQIIVDKYGDNLCLVMNSWGRWNSGGRTILGTNIQIPEGAFWARWRDIQRRDFYALSGANGFPAQKLPDWGSASYLDK
jgi:hypothetical protein